MEKEALLYGEGIRNLFIVWSTPIYPKRKGTPKDLHPSIALSEICAWGCLEAIIWRTVRQEGPLISHLPSTESSASEPPLSQRVGFTGKKDSMVSGSSIQNSSEVHACSFSATKCRRPWHEQEIQEPCCQLTGRPRMSSVDAWLSHLHQLRT